MRLSQCLKKDKLNVSENFIKSITFYKKNTDMQNLINEKEPDLE